MTNAMDAFPDKDAVLGIRRHRPARDTANEQLAFTIPFI